MVLGIGYLLRYKVENILKGSPGSIPSPSPSVRIQMVGKLTRGVKANIAGCFALLPQVNFPANNLNFH